MNAAAAATLLVTNAIFLVGFGWPLAKALSHNLPGPWGTRAWMVALSAIYLAECVAFSASMGTNILSILLAVLWGLVLWRKVRVPRLQNARWLVLGFSVYTCLPALSFLSLLGLLVWDGWSLLATEDGRRFGVPGFVPWPMCSLLGFFLTVSGSAVLLKTGITTGMFSLLLRGSRQTRDTPSRGSA